MRRRRALPQTGDGEHVEAALQCRGVWQRERFALRRAFRELEHAARYEVQDEESVVTRGDGIRTHLTPEIVSLQERLQH
jgi:hypothetical protein